MLELVSKLVLVLVLELVSKLALALVLKLVSKLALVLELVLTLKLELKREQEWVSRVQLRVSLKDGNVQRWKSEFDANHSRVSSREDPRVS